MKHRKKTKAEQTLLSAQRRADEYKIRFQALHSASFGGIAIHDKGLILECNQGLSDISGFTVEELIGMEGMQLISSSTRELVMSNILAGYEKPYEAFGVRKNGEEYPVRLEAKVIPYRGKLVRVVEFRDITEQKEAEAKQRSLEKQLRHSQKLESIGTMVGGISHELNNVLQSIFLYGDLIREDLPEDTKLQKNFNLLLTDAKRARDIVKQVLTFSRKTKVEMKPQKIHSLVMEPLALERVSLPANIEITTDIDTDCGLVLCDKTQIHQIIINLCNNARHSMEKTGGELSVSLHQIEANRTLDEPEIEMVELKVSDTGHGMTTKTIEKIFDPFFTTKNLGKGTGLGLSVVHGIVQMMEGEIAVSSKEGVGTTFRIILPVSTKIHEDIISEATLSTNTGLRSILLVDDEDSIRSTTQIILTKKGFTIDSAVDGQAALKLFRDNPGKYDLIVTDLSMPNLTGAELTRKIRNSGSDIPIILSTGQLGIEDQKGFRNIGLSGFIQKPWTAEELIECIRGL